ncbi:SMI1/KNR4 family protein [Chryseobacterium sp.]|uniref:SMI1/KNR4 family protein n=1 Tax=Chryseobacterium sp. TaxID=1871047 RepID=UPI0035C6E86C
MNFENYRITPNYNTNKTDLFLATEQEIELCEKTLAIEFDDDYKDYVLTFGNGILGGTYIRMYLPKRIMNTLSKWKNRITEYWFWDEGKDILTKDEVLNSVRVGDTFDGDELILYKSYYYILPRHSEKIYKIGKTLDEMITWLCSTGILTEPFVERDFEPFDPVEWGK